MSALVSSRTGSRTVQLWAFVLVLLGHPLFAAVRPPSLAEDFDRAATSLVAEHHARLAELAEWCNEQGLSAEAEKIRRWMAPRDPNKLYFPLFPEVVGGSKLPPDAPEAARQWEARWTRLRNEQAEALCQLARRAARGGRASLALELVLAAIHENPDHEAIRTLLGFQQFDGRWRTPYEIQNLRMGKVWHERFGWLPQSHVERYEQGQRYHLGRWISAEADALLHRDIRNGWDVASDHFTIRTNHSIEAAVELGQKLEQLYRVWRQLFVSYFAGEAQLAAMFDGRRIAPPSGLPTYSVVYFRDRANYNQALRGQFPNIEVSVGLYDDGTRRAYFFAGEDYDQRTLFHEATHQLFHQSRPVAANVARQANFWIVEGVAMYLESLRREDDCYVLGGFNDVRMQAARHRLLVDNFYIPLAEFSALGMDEIQSDKRIATLYSQAAGLTHFLIHYDGGRYRDALVAYLTAVYDGRADAGTLSKLTATPYAELDGHYRQFMESGNKRETHKAGGG